MTQKIFLIAGEHSGDVLGAGLIEALRGQAGGDVEFSGIGGPLMEQEGFTTLLPMDELCVIGLWEIVWQLPRLLKLIEGVVAEIEKFNPDVVVTIDLPDFNFQVGKRLKARGICGARVVHYVAPTVWAWRQGRAKKVSEFLDGLICLFPHEPPYFTKYNLKTEFIGHPLIEYDPSEADGAGFRKMFEIPPEAPVLGLFFGSRESEFKAHAEILKEAAAGIKEQYPDLHVVVPTLPHLEYEVRQIIGDVDYPAFVLVNPDDKWDEFAACNVALAVSGTVGLELAYMGIPHVIAYRVHLITFILLRLLVKVKYAHLANILLNEEAIPEYLQSKCNALDITKGLLKLFKDENERKIQMEKTRKLRDLLNAGPDKTPSQRAAEFVLRIAKEPVKKLVVKPSKIPKDLKNLKDLKKNLPKADDLLKKIPKGVPKKSAKTPPPKQPPKKPPEKAA